MLDAEAQVLEIAVLPAQRSQFSLADSEPTIQKHQQLVAKF